MRVLSTIFGTTIIGLMFQVPECIEEHKPGNYISGIGTVRGEFEYSIGQESLKSVQTPKHSDNPHGVCGDPKFKVFDGTRYLGKPDLRRYGIEPIPIVYAAQIWTRSVKGKNIPTDQEVRGAAERQIPPVAPLVVLDIETWPLRYGGGNQALIEQTASMLSLILDAFRDLRPSSQFGYYLIGPVRDFRCSIRDLSHLCNDRWRQESYLLRTLLENVDVMFPSLYTISESTSDWVRYARRHVAEARKLSKGRPVYPFIWPATHHLNKHELTYLSPTFWRLQLETIAQSADGVVIWGGFDPVAKKRERWNSEAAWWKETIDWMCNSEHSEQPAISLRQKKLILR